MKSIRTYEGLSNPVILESLNKTHEILNHSGFRNICVSISGGADSDIVLDLCERNAETGGIRYLWIDTGMEYEATKEHLFYLENRYHRQIDRRDAFLSIPDCCSKYGQPFLSKQVSDNIGHLQQHGFQWEDAPFGELIRKYPKCDSALRWWCNKKQGKKEGMTSHFEIAWNKGLKEFILQNPPRFSISNKCCKYAKMKSTETFHKEIHTDLSVCGVRKAEGGIRATAYKGTFSFNKGEALHTFRPIYHFANQTRKDYAMRFDICHSHCYTQYGMKRTGCAGCPLNRNILFDLSVLKHNEPHLYRKALDVFGDSYEYTRQYRAFCKASS